MHLDRIWRYPVKSMGGESLTAAELGSGGIPGDRLLHVEDARGRVVTSRSRPRLLTHRASLDPDGEVRVDGRPWDASEVAADVLAAAGPGTRLVRFEGAERFDVLPLLVATDGALAAFGHDWRRLRPNFVIAGVPGLSERAWEGRRLAIGAAVIEVASLRERCIMTTFDPDTAEQDVSVLLGIRAKFDGRIALDCAVLEGAPIQVGDPVRLLD